MAGNADFVTSAALCPGSADLSIQVSCQMAKSLLCLDVLDQTANHQTRPVFSPGRGRFALRDPRQTRVRRAKQGRGGSPDPNG